VARTPSGAALSADAQAPWWFRNRFYTIGGAYFVGFFVGGLIAAVATNGHVEPAYAQIIDLWPSLGVRGALAIATLIAAIGTALRLWGSSYLSSSVVWSESIETQKLHIVGPFRYTRNPLYLGNLFLAAGIGLTGPWETTLLVVVLNYIALRMLIAAEEPQLRAKFGGAYEAYSRAVPRLFPRLTPVPANESAEPNWREGLRTETIFIGFTIGMVMLTVTREPLWLWAFVIAGFVVRLVRRSPSGTK